MDRAGMRQGNPINKGTGDAGAASGSLVYIIGGAIVGILIVVALSWILDAESKNTFLWERGRYLLVIATAFAGSMAAAGKGRVVAENIECFAIAVVMALILKHFLIEAYKIPTGSMQPTILGNDDVGIFDRVLVNKFAYLIDDPERYDVVVFKYPLDRSKNYIKRLIGLPGERVSIFNGNIYTAKRDANGDYGPSYIARKDHSVRDSVLKVVYPSGRDDETLGGSFTMVDGDGEVGTDEIRLSAGAAFRYGDGEPIRDRYLDGYDPDWGIPVAFRLTERGTENVGDLAIAFDVTPADGCQSIEAVITAFGLEHRAVLAVGDAGESYLESGFPNRADRLERPPFYDGDSTVVASDPTRLRAGSTYRVGFMHVDQQLLLTLDGDTLLEFGYEVPEPLPVTRNSIEVSCAGAGATFADLAVRRDIHYTNTNGGREQTFDVPDDSIFVLGDNTQNSSDGRAWRAQEVRFPDGRTIVAEYQSPNAAYVDIFGERYPYSTRNQPRISALDPQAYSFVPTKLLLGKAIAVFWPIYPHFRWKLIR